MTTNDVTAPVDPMLDVTFTIPVRIDSDDRLSNLLAVVRYLRRTYPSRVIIGIEEPGPLRAIVPSGVEIVAIDGPRDLPFHHTRVLNDLARRVTTAVLINIETDIIIPEPQLREAVRRAATGQADLVLPYDEGVEIPREERKAFAAGEVTALSADGRERWGWAVIGGCVVWNTASFFRFGMENEHFISWGLEDDERLARVAKLGGVVERCHGPLFHLQHRRGPDSSSHTRTTRTTDARWTGFPWSLRSTSRPRSARGRGSRRRHRCPSRRSRPTISP